jgi:tripartite ATP-independent transporter DctM subunit
MLSVSLVPPVVLILSVLGAIFFGIAAPTEASALGASASILLAIAYRKFSLRRLEKAAVETLRITSFVMLIASLSFAAVGIFLRLGCDEVVTDLIMSMPFGRWGVFGAVMFIVFILGFFIDWIGIVFIVIPIVMPVFNSLGFDPLWISMMICINLQTSFMTPPFASAIFICQGVAPKELGITTIDIIRGVIPFIGLAIIGLALCIVFPQLVLWLPSMMIKPW